MGPRLAVSASRPDSVKSPHAYGVAAAARDAGFSVTELMFPQGVAAREDDSTQIIDFLVALDPRAVLSSRPHLLPHNLGMAVVVVADHEPDDEMRRAVRLADVVVAPPERHAALREMPLRPAILDVPSTGSGWRAVLDEATANRDRRQRHGTA